MLKENAALAGFAVTFLTALILGSFWHTVVAVGLGVFATIVLEKS